MNAFDRTHYCEAARRDVGAGEVRGTSDQAPSDVCPHCHRPPAELHDFPALEDVDVGAVVELPTDQAFAVVAVVEHRIGPDEYTVERIPTDDLDSREVTWRDHHVENAILCGASVVPKGCTWL